jgi:RsiW-degrading membrane proteinase PrsW (M82 family)
MKDKHKKHVHTVLYYAPRIFAIIVGLFFFLMLTDLRPGFTFLEFLGKFLPGFIVILAIILTWNNPRRASLVFAILALVYTIIGWIYMQDNVIGAITVPMIIVSALLIINAKSHMFV